MHSEMGRHLVPPGPKDRMIAKYRAVAKIRKDDPEGCKDPGGEAVQGHHHDVFNVGVSMALYRNLEGRYFAFGEAFGVVEHYGQDDRDDPDDVENVHYRVRDDSLFEGCHNVSAAVRIFRDRAKNHLCREGSLFHITDSSLCGAEYMRALKEECGETAI